MTVYSCVVHTGHETGFCMMCTMQNHITQVFANDGIFQPMGIINELKSKNKVISATVWIFIFFKIGTELSHWCILFNLIWFIHA